MKDELEIVIVIKWGPDNSKQYAAFPKWFIFEPGGVFKKSIPEAAAYFKEQLLRHFGVDVPARRFAWRAFNGSRSMELIDTFRPFLTPDKIDQLPLSIQTGEEYLFEKGAAGWGRALQLFENQEEFLPINMKKEDVKKYNWLNNMAVRAGSSNLIEIMRDEATYFK